MDMASLNVRRFSHLGVQVTVAKPLAEDSSFRIAHVSMNCCKMRLVVSTITRKN